MSEQKILLQFYLRENLIFYKGFPLRVPEEDLLTSLSDLPETITNENDKLTFFTYFDENSYKAERRKKYYDYILEKQSEKTYEYNYSKEDAKILFDKLIFIYERYKNEQLESNKTRLKSEIQAIFSERIFDLRRYRNELLEKSDWTQMPDIPFSEADKLLWKKYRQTLRDLPQDDNWIYTDFYTIVFPIDPISYKIKYPNLEVEYLSTPDQFENKQLQKQKLKMLALIDSLKLPSLDSFEIENLDMTNSYKKYVDFVNSYLNKIDPDLRLDIEIKTTPGENPSISESLSGIGESGPYSLELVNGIADLLDDPDNYTQEALENLFE